MCLGCGECYLFITLLDVLRSAGVVDAGGLGFVVLLEGIAGFIDRGRAGRNEARSEEFPLARR